MNIKQHIIIQFFISLAICHYRRYNCDRCSQYETADQRNDCTQACQSGRVYGIVIIIVICVVALLFLIGCCFFLGGIIKKKYYEHTEKKKRKAYRGGISLGEFQKQFENFANIFTEGNRDLWVLAFSERGVRYQMQWFSFKTKQISDFQHRIFIDGQDTGGTWQIKGAYVNTQKGIIFWFEKQYTMDKVSNDKKGIMLVFEMIKNQEGYQGQWYYRGRLEKGRCSLNIKGQDQLFYREGMNQEDVASNPSSDLHL